MMSVFLLCVAGSAVFMFGYLVGRAYADDARTGRIRELYESLVERVSIFEQEVRAEDDGLAERAVMRTRNRMAGADG